MTDYKDENVWIMNGDCLERLKEMEDNSVDSIVSDRHVELSEILAKKLPVETTVALLNEMEKRYSKLRKRPHGNSKRIYPFWKTCKNCRKPFMAHTNEQATRKKTCSKECKDLLIKKSKTGKVLPKEKLKGKTIACTACGKEVWKPDAWLRKVKAPTCSRECNGKLRGQEWKKHAHEGRSKWTPASNQALKERMTGSSNPSWKGGVTYRNRKGTYAKQSIKYVRCPRWLSSMARKDGYIMEHRMKVAQSIGRALDRSEAVHHINHDATDNRLENLMLFRTNGEHKSFEHGANINPLWCGLNHSNPSIKCGECNCQRSYL